MTAEPPDPGWPAHRVSCKPGDVAVQTTVTSVSGYPWTIRRCGSCAQVALSPGRPAPMGGDAA